MTTPPPNTLFYKGATRTDLRVTRAPANSPRGRLHLSAALGARVARKAGRTVAGDALVRAKTLAQRGIDSLRLDGSRGARLLVRLCVELNRTAAALEAFVELDVPSLCEELTGVLTMLEASEARTASVEREASELRQMVAFERSHNEQLRASLAAEQVRTAAALRDVPDERWSEETRKRELTAEERRAIGGSDAK